MYVLKSAICFIGMPGSGKTTLTSLMGCHFNLPYIDLDEFIEKQLGISIAELWDSEGEIAFRSIERFHLLKVLSGKPVIISTGGGTPCFYDNMNVLREYSFCIYLKMNKPNLTESMISGIHPVFNGPLSLMEQWDQLLKRRSSFYEQAHFMQAAFNIEPNVFEAVSKICLEEKVIIKNYKV